MISVSEALMRLAELAALGVEEVPIAEAAGRVLAREVRATSDSPPFETSAMDGYAVRLADVSGPGASLAERPRTVAAGDEPPGPVGPGEAVRVMTGAPLPPGAEAVIPVERATRVEGRVRFGLVPAPGEHIRHRGESVAAGALLLERGQRLSPCDVALAALAGADPVPVFRAPRVSIAVTGNEIVPVSTVPAPGKLRDSNGPALVSLCRARGWRAALRGGVPDEETSIRELFATAGENEDLLVTTGGVSAGDLDLLPGVAGSAGFEILFHGVSMRPGKPILLARRAGVLWFGLPGNPVSASVGFHLFVREAIGRLEGDAHPGAPRVTALLSRAIKATGPRETYRDARWEIAQGQSHAEPLHSLGSHDLAAHGRANALIRTPAGAGPLGAGEIVECVVIGEVESRQSTVDSSGTATTRSP